MAAKRTTRIGTALTLIIAPLVGNIARTCGCYEGLYAWSSPRIIQRVESVNLSLDTGGGMVHPNHQNQSWSIW